TYGGSETLLSKVALDKRGDLYIPADDSYLEKGRAKGLLDEDIPLARMTAGIAVRKSNPKKNAKLSDLLRKDVRLALDDPGAAAVGSVLRQKLDAGTWKALNDHARVSTATEPEVANAVRVGSADAGIVWDSTVRSSGGALVAVSELKKARGSVRVAVLRCC